MRRYFFGVVLVIALLVLLIVLISHGGNRQTVPSSSRTLESYATTNATVSMEIDGPVNANQNHNQLLVTVGSSSATIEALQGYNGTVIKSATYPSTEAAYSVFLNALDYAGFTKGVSTSDLSSEAGYCPTGDRYVFELQQNSRKLERYWTTNCSSTPHSFEGDTALIYTLFQQQIPNYNSFVQNLNI